jgi:polysaccharide deacetylase family protein (PEP-CTERM system associated)
MPFVLSIDYENWVQLVHAEATGVARAVGRDGLARATDALLELLARRSVLATVFLLGTTAAAFPDLARRVADAGHEIACHGHQHLHYDRLDAQTITGELRRALATIEAATGQRPVGFRAPYFSVRRTNLWALELVAEAGFRYDSSIFPIIHRRYGIAGWPREPHLVAGGRLVELPLATVEVFGVRLPIAGGGYFRALPTAQIVAALDGLALAGRSAVLYLHPYQLDLVPPPRVPGPLPWRGRLHATAFRAAQSVGHRRSRQTLEALLGGHRWVTAGALASAFAGSTLTSGTAAPIEPRSPVAGSAGRGTWSLT